MPVNSIVLVKQVPDTANVTAEAMKADGTVNRGALPADFNPEDLNALEEALSIKETHGGHVTALTMGPPQAKSALFRCLELGADRAVLVSDRKFAGADTWATALTLSAAITAAAPDCSLILMGKQAIDGDNSQTAQMLAALWDRPQATFASKLELNGSSASVTREVDAGLETIEVDLPAVISVDLRMNEPRFVKLPDIMKAKRKEVKKTTPAELGVEAKSATAIQGLTEPPPRATMIRSGRGSAPPGVSALKP